VTWDELAGGKECPFDLPRAEPNDYWDSVIRLSTSTLCLLKNQAYRGQCILIFDLRHAIRLDDLSAAEWSGLMNDLHQATKAVAAVCCPDHVNVACEGNVIPHLHWHIIPRYKSDPRWGAPITMTTMDEMAHAKLPDVERSELIDELRSSLV
jgi:diadenosine tetraphosphate (Ap4A) HIT family hydrolase